MNRYRTKATWRPYGGSERFLYEEYDTESESKAKEKFRDNHPRMCGTGSIWKVDKI